eukprot:1885534-Amphidinium_carterae.1
MNVAYAQHEFTAQHAEDCMQNKLSSHRIHLCCCRHNVENEQRSVRFHQGIGVLFGSHFNFGFIWHGAWRSL